MTTSILFTQTNPGTLTAVHSVPNQVITPFTPPLPAGGLLTESGVVGQMSEFLFKMEKDGQIYWIGAAVPDGTSDFSKVQVFFHPTVVQRDARGPVVVAAEGDYPTFTGGWSGGLQRYVALQGGQLAAAPKQMALIVPFMRMAAFGGRAPAYMFATRPTDTLNAIMEAVQNAAVGGPNPPLQVARIGVTSFSSGIGAMRLFIGTFGSSGLIVETTDFDSPFIQGKFSEILYIDGFAGPGEYEDGKVGSPIIALDTALGFKPPLTAKLHFLFVEERDDRADHLR